MKRIAGLLLKAGVTLGIFLGIFLEFGGGYHPVDTATLATPGTFEMSNPAFPGLVGRVKARFLGTPLPPPTLTVGLDKVCWEATEHTVFVRTSDTGMRPFKPLRHCGEGGLIT